MGAITRRRGIRAWARSIGTDGYRLRSTAGPIPVRGNAAYSRAEQRRQQKSERECQHDRTAAERNRDNQPKDEKEFDREDRGTGSRPGETLGVGACARRGRLVVPGRSARGTGRVESASHGSRVAPPTSERHGCQRSSQAPRPRPVSRERGKRVLGFPPEPWAAAKLRRYARRPDSQCRRRRSEAAQCAASACRSTRLPHGLRSRWSGFPNRTASPSLTTRWRLDPRAPAGWVPRVYAAILSLGEA